MVNTRGNIRGSILLSGQVDTVNHWMIERQTTGDCLDCPAWKETSADVGSTVVTLFGYQGYQEPVVTTVKRLKLVWSGHVTPSSRIPWRLVDRQADRNWQTRWTDCATWHSLTAGQDRSEC